MSKKAKTIINAAFALYATLMLWLLFGQRIGRDMFGSYQEMLQSNINLIPMQTIRIFINTLSGSDYGYALRHAIINLAGNVVMFVPLGFFIPSVFPKNSSFFRSMILCASIVISIEAVQLFTLLGSCDIDDLILNLIGAAVGYGIYLIILKEAGNNGKTGENP